LLVLVVVESGIVVPPVYPGFLIALDVLPVCTDDTVFDGRSTFFEQAVKVVIAATVITVKIVFFMIDNFSLLRICFL
jgi:hypothetical protein